MNMPNEAAPIPIADEQRGQQSRLEQLPDALLRRICIHSGNVNLARSSLHLLRILDSVDVKQGLIKHVFSSWHIKEHEEGEDIDWDDAPDHGWLPHAQQALLRMRWCTPELLTQTLQHHLMSTAFRVLARWLWRAPKDHQNAIAHDMWDYLEQMFHLRNSVLESGSNVVPTREEVGWALWRYKTPTETEESPIRFQVSFDGLGRPPDMEITALIFPGRRARRGPKRWKVHRLSAPNFVRPLEIPARLLCGPWTQTKGNLLRMLRTSWEPGPQADPKLLEAGLMGALRESCVPAILALTRREGRNLEEISQCLTNMPRRERRRGPFVGDVHADDPWAGFDDLWASAEQLWYLRPACLTAYPIYLQHFELLFERARDFGRVAFENIVVILMKEAIVAGTCSLSELMNRARLAELKGQAHTPWGAGLWGQRPVDFILDAWRDARISLRKIVAAACEENVRKRKRAA